MKVGILGGTFNPVHNGHLAVAGEGARQFGLKRVLFVPAGKPWMKACESIAQADHRIAMIKLAIKGIPEFELSLVEIDRDGLTFTVDTLVEMQKTLAKGAGLTLLMGWDSLQDMPLWKDPQRIIRMCRIAAFTRTGADIDTGRLEKAIPGIKKRLNIIDMHPVDISSTEIRRRAAAGRSIHGMVPDSVEKYILEHRLYKQAGT
jgi:nicotinate-nucleotide adenylyltransferase